MKALIRLGSHPTVLTVSLMCLQKLLPKFKRALWLRPTAGASCSGTVSCGVQKTCVKEDFCRSVLFLMWKYRKLFVCVLLHSQGERVSSYRPLLSTGLVIPPQNILYNANPPFVSTGKKIIRLKTAGWRGHQASVHSMCSSCCRQNGVFVRWRKPTTVDCHWTERQVCLWVYWAKDRDGLLPACTLG